MDRGISGIRRSNSILVARSDSGRASLIAIKAATAKPVASIVLNPQFALVRDGLVVQVDEGTDVGL